MQRVLIAEENQFYRHALAAALTEWGFAAIPVGDGLKALEIFQGPQPPQLAIIDRVMPKMDGLELCKKIRELNLSEPPYLIVLTSKSPKADVGEALNAGADDYIAKPFDRAELQARVRAGVRAAGLQTR